MKIMFAGVAAAFFAATGAHAAEISFSESATAQFDPVVTLSGFDPSLGTLQSAELEFELIYTNDIDYFVVCEETAGCNDSWTFETTASVNVFGDTIGSGSGAVTFDCIVPLNGVCDTGQVLSATAAGSMALDLADLLGVATFDVFGDTPPPTEISGPFFPSFFDIFPSASLSATVTYTFDDGSVPPIPLPMSGLLLLTGFGGIAVMGRHNAERAKKFREK